MFVSTYVPYMLMCGIVAQSFTAHAQQEVMSQRPDRQNIPTTIDDQKMIVDISDTPLVGDYQTIFDIHSGLKSNENAALKFSRLSKPGYPYVGTVKQYSGSDSLGGTPRQLIKVNVKERPKNQQKTDAILVRTKRGFGSAVADRIAHGFGKRANAIDLQDEQLKAVKALLDFSRVEQDVYDDDVNTLVRLYRKYGNRKSNQPLDSRHPLLANADAELLKKLLANMPDADTETRNFEVADLK